MQDSKTPEGPLMHPMQPHPLILSSLALLMLAASLHARAETTECTVIDTVPYVISSAGVYCLKSKLVSAMGTGSAITINTNNVTLDMNGYRLGGRQAGDTSTAKGIYALNRKNIHIRNGTIRGFFLPISLTDSSSPPSISEGHLIEDMLVESSYSGGILVRGNNSTIRNNRIFHSGYTAATTGNYVPSGIDTRGSGVRIIDNDIHHTFGRNNGGGKGISAARGDNLIILGNRITETLGENGLGMYGIYTGTGSDRILIKDNVISNATQTGTVAIRIDGSSNELCIGNTILNFASAYPGCTDGGGNVVQ